MPYYHVYLASAYGESTYSASTYSAQSSTSTGGGSDSAAGGGKTTTSTGASGSSTGGGVLTNTGFDVVAGVTLACVIIFIALVVRFWKRPAKAEQQISN